MINSVNELPDISFIDNITVDSLKEDAVRLYQEAYKNETGEDIALAPADPYRLMLYACVLLIYQGMQYSDRAGKMNLVKYSYGDALDNIAALRGVARNEASPAKTTLRFSISAPLPSVVSIPAGTRATDGNGVYFFTDRYVEIPSGDICVDVPATCTDTGAAGNGYYAGQVNTLVEILPYISSVENITETGGGSGREDDDSFRERIYLAPSSYSVAGPLGAYIFLVKSYSPLIGDVKPYSPAPVEVEIRFLMADGSLPDEAMMKSVHDYLDGDVRPLTDKVTVLAPETVEFDIDLTYYVDRSRSIHATDVQDAVQAAVDSYLDWQTVKIGRDVNPTDLITRVRLAGAKRVDIVAPEYIPVDDKSVARVRKLNVRYGGVEDD